MRRVLLALLTVSLLVPAVPGAAQDGTDMAQPAPSSVGSSLPPGLTSVPLTGDLAVEVRRTAFGVPHVVAEDWRSLGYGYGYALAQDNLCEVADTYVTVRAERSRWFGPDASYDWVPLGATYGNLESDFFFERINATGVVEELLAAPPPHGPVQEVRDGVAGFVGGYNRYLADVGVDNLPDPRCRGAAWVQPIAEIDVYRYFYRLLLLASSGFFLGEIVDAAPPLSGAVPAPSQAEHAAALAAWDGSGLPRPSELAIGSNAYGIGSDLTRTGRGMLLGNPHFPWTGTERFHQMHLTIPGELDVAGAALLGVPLVLIGFNQHVAWSHTVSTAYRFTPYELRLVPGNPTAYLYGAEVREMTATEVTVDVLTQDGTLEPRSHTFYDTHYGPMFQGVPAVPGVNVFEWTPLTGYALRDANAEGFRSLNQFWAMDQATSVRDLKAVQDEYQGIPWVNTMAADSTGETYYGDHSIVPHVTDEQADACARSPVAIVVAQLVPGLPVLDGSDPACEWGEDPDAVVPGIFGPSNLPMLFRRDFINNANDSYWLANPGEPLTGFDRIIGAEGTQRSLRTRMNLVQVADRAAGTDGLDPAPGYTLDALEEMLHGNRVLSVELARDEVVALCGGMAAEGTVPATACDVLAGWSGRFDTDQHGPLLWRRFWERLPSPIPWQVPFDAADPVHTPRDLDTSDAGVRDALVAAVADLDAAGIPLDATWGSAQGVTKGADFLPIGGTSGEIGSFNAISSTWTDGEGLADVSYGSSYIQAVAFNDTPCPDASTIISYSQSTDPTSAHFADMTRLFSQEQWVDLPFCREDVLAETESLLQFDGDEDVRGVTRVGGEDRVATAIAVSRHVHAGGADAVVLAQAGQYADALAGAPLAHQLDAPLLLTGGDALDARVAVELARLGATSVVLLGGEAALSPAVATALATAGLAIDRIGGADRFATAAAIVPRLTGHGGAAYAVEGLDADAARGWPDAVAVAGLAAATGRPLLLVETDALPTSTAAALTAAGITDVTVVGGAAAVSEATAAALADPDGDGTGQVAVGRLAGASRYATSRAVAEASVAAGLDPDRLWLATGRDWPDALSAGPAAAAAGAVLALVDGADLAGSPETAALIGRSSVVLVGGPAAISPAVAAEIQGRVTAPN